MNGGDASITYQNERLMVSGDLNFNTVMNVWNNSLPLLNSGSDLQFDLSNVISANSAGLVLLIEWVKYAKKVGKAISFHYMPAQLNSIISVAGVSGFLMK